MAITLTENGVSYSPEGRRVIRKGNGKEYWLLRWGPDWVQVHDYHRGINGNPALRTVARRTFEACYDYPAAAPM